jgi:predicted AAA+ superfamily ATPase
MIKRSLNNIIKEINDTFKVILITGPRQVGKTTLLEICAKESRNYVTLDDLDKRELAIKDPALFLQAHPPPIVIDEVQYAPELFSAIKIIVDREKDKRGLFWLTGSQKFHLMKGITESLAGRVAIVDLLGLSQVELDDRAGSSEPFMPTKAWIEKTKPNIKKPKPLLEIYEKIWRGSFPELWTKNKDEQATTSKVNRDLFYKSYVQTYIQRDVRDMVQVNDETSFNRFLGAVAARTGQLLNFSDIARDVDIDHKTVKSWFSVLETSGLVYLLQPYYRNVTKRIVKTPKLYFLDTGLCAYLTKWPTAASLEAGTMTGAILETYMFAEILKSYLHNGKTPFFYYYRDTDQHEVDLLIETGGEVYPVEFKKTARPYSSAPRNFKMLKKLDKEVGHGAVICFVEEPMPLSDEVTAIPVGYL